MYRESVVGSVIQATGTVEFEDGLWIGNHLKAQNGLQMVGTIPGVLPGAVQSTWVPPEVDLIQICLGLGMASC